MVWTKPRIERSQWKRNPSTLVENSGRARNQQVKKKKVGRGKENERGNGEQREKKEEKGFKSLSFMTVPSVVAW